MHYGVPFGYNLSRTLSQCPAYNLDVMVGMLVASKLGELDRDVYNEKKEVSYN